MRVQKCSRSGIPEKNDENQVDDEESADDNKSVNSGNPIVLYEQSIALAEASLQVVKKIT